MLNQPFLSELENWRAAGRYRTLISFAAGIAVGLIVLRSYAAQPTETYGVIDVKDGGSVIGEVLRHSNNDETDRWPVNKDESVCGAEDRVLAPRIKDQRLLDVVVFIENIKSGKNFEPEADAVTLDQEHCRFRPQLQVIRDGAAMSIRNLDPVLHNVQAYELIYSARRSVLNIVQQGATEDAASIRVTRGSIIKIECAAHDFMHGWFFVARNPYYAMVDSQGRFRIDGVPAGHYRIGAWHWRFGFLESAVDILPHEETSMDFSYI